MDIFSPPPGAACSAAAAPGADGAVAGCAAFPDALAPVAADASEPVEAGWAALGFEAAVPGGDAEAAGAAWSR
ncbi:hypothetical protein QN397_17325 [Variovorax sp. RTB1]|nr:hypothetical protein [Variovorax sp. RTB1]